MKHIAFVLFISCLLPAAQGTLSAQSMSDRPEHPFYVSLQGGVRLSLNENYKAYFDESCAGKLINAVAALSFGYDFSHRFGIRLNCSYGKNSGACNYEESHHIFYPYTFKSVNIFADAVLNLSSRPRIFSPKLYAGIGMGSSFGFTDSGHPWQKVSTSNTAFGFRIGFMPQWDLSSQWSIFADLCGEIYTDSYNGISPDAHDDSGTDSNLTIDFNGGLLSAGVMFHF